MTLNGLTSQIISIHVPREGHDDTLAPRIAAATISIHVPREGHDKGAGG